MPTEYIRKGNVNRGQWSEGNLKEAVRRLQANEISFREAERYYGIPARTLKKKTGIRKFKQRSNWSCR
jgi:hypothetical protein